MTYILRFDQSINVNQCHDKARITTSGILLDAFQICMDRYIRSIRGLKFGDDLMTSMCLL